MAKRQETLEIEAALQKDTQTKRIYGCEEITIGFYNNGHGNEIVDFMTMDSKGIIKCYEIKVTIQDFKSDAKKSWRGHYNYLVVGKKLWNEHKDYILENTPKHKYSVHADAQYDTSKKYYDEAFAILDSCRIKIINTGKFYLGEYKYYLDKIIANIPKEYQRFYQDLSV